MSEYKETEWYAFNFSSNYVSYPALMFANLKYGFSSLHNREN